MNGMKNAHERAISNRAIPLMKSTNNVTPSAAASADSPGRRLLNATANASPQSGSPVKRMRSQALNAILPRKDSSRLKP